MNKAFALYIIIFCMSVAVSALLFSIGKIDKEELIVCSFIFLAFGCIVANLDTFMQFLAGRAIDTEFTKFK